jgi:hypothetical protein
MLMDKDVVVLADLVKMRPKLSSRTQVWISKAPRLHTKVHVEAGIMMSTAFFAQDGFATMIWRAEHTTLKKSGQRPYQMWVWGT